MAFRGGRGRGRGRGFGGSDFKYAEQKSFELFPKIALPDRKNVPEEKKLAVLNFKFRNGFQSSPYHLEETCSEEETVDIERFSDMVNQKSRFNRESLLGSGYLKLEPGYFPLELVRGTKFKKRKVQWNPKRDFQKLDFLEELEKKLEAGDTKGKKEKEGDGEDDGEEEEDVEGEEEDEIESDDDYAKGYDFDDDEDDYNMDDGGDDEATM